MIARLAALFTLIALPALADMNNIREVTSPGGIKAWLAPAPDIPFVALELRFKGGTSLDAEGKEGAVSLMTSLLEEGTGDLDAGGFAAARDSLAAGFYFRSGPDTVAVSARFLSENRDESLDLLRRAISAPSFSADAVERVRMQLIANLRASEQDPQSRAGELFNRIAFPGHPYARPSDGTVASVSALTREDLQAAHRGALARDNVVVAAAGDITPEDLGAALDRLLSDLPATAAAAPGPAPLALTGQVVIEEFPGPQAVILFGHEGLSFDAPDFFPAFIAAEILGGGRFGTRLMTEVREKRGLTYGIGAGFSDRAHADILMGQVQTANGTVKDTLEVIRAEWARLGDISDEELEAAKKYLTGAYPLRWDGNANIAQILVSMQLTGYPVDYPQSRNARIEAVTLEEVRTAARKYFRAEDLSFAIVGRPEGLAAE